MKACISISWAGKGILPLVLALTVLFAVAGAAQPPNEGYIQVPGLIHLDSVISGGESTPEELAAAARTAGAGFAFLTDHDTQMVSYGFPPFRKLLKVRQSRDSVRSYGIEKYLQNISEINRDTSGFVMLPGIESVPYYLWDRSGGVRLQYLHRHLLVLGLDRPEDLAHLPSIEVGYPSRYTRNSLLRLLWVVPLLVALYMITRNGERGNAVRNAFPLRIVAWGMLVISGLALAEAYPFREERITQYPPDRGAEPYQRLIDYVHARGGMTFWAHPEASWTVQVGQSSNPLVRFMMERLTGGELSLETGAYPHLLNDTFDYTGFAIFNEGAKTVGAPGGLWDDLLIQFCAGARDRPVWAVAEQELESGATPSAAGETRTVLLVHEKSAKEYLQALRNGRMYCFTAYMDTRMKFREYAVLSGNGRAISGEVIGWSPDARLTLDLEIADASRNLEMVVIRDGTVLDRRGMAASGGVEIPLLPPARELSYVRVAVYSGDTMVAATNPIFFTGKGTQ